jgi:hypothetical protein
MTAQNVLDTLNPKIIHNLEALYEKHPEYKPSTTLLYSKATPVEILHNNYIIIKEVWSKAKTTNKTTKTKLFKELPALNRQNHRTVDNKGNETAVKHNYFVHQLDTMEIHGPYRKLKQAHWKIEALGGHHA